MGGSASLSRPLVALATLLALLSLPRPGLAAPGDSLLDYGFDVVSDYVSRGVDQFVVTYDRSGDPHGAFNTAPALQPSFTLHGPGGFSFGVWGSFALLHRSPEPAKNNFPGLKVLDEIDYTLAWDWSNKLGAFGVGLAAYTFPATLTPLVTNNELYLRYAPAILPALAPTVTHYVSPDDNTQAPTASYTMLGVGGGEALMWKLSVGASRGIKDVTGGLTFPFGTFSLSANIAYRPNPELVSGPLQGSAYGKDGKYAVAGTGQAMDYPKTIAWIVLSFADSVTE